jgi:hypothetical protein
MLGANRSSRAKRFGDANFEALSSNLEKPNAVAMQIRPMCRGRARRGTQENPASRTRGLGTERPLLLPLSSPKKSRSFESGGFFEVVSAECAYRRSQRSDLEETLIELNRWKRGRQWGSMPVQLDGRWPL